MGGTDGGKSQRRKKVAAAVEREKSRSPTPTSPRGPKSMRPSVDGDKLIVMNGLGCCMNGCFWPGLCFCCPICKGEWTLWCIACQCCLDTGAEHLKCVCCEPQCTGCGPNCARFFKCSCQCCCCVQLGALPCTAEMPCTCALLGYMCYPSRQRGCCHKLLPPLNDEGVTLQEMNRDGTVRKA